MNAIKNSFERLAAPSELRLETMPIAEPKRFLPLGLAVRIWLQKSVLFGAILVAIALIVMTASWKRWDLPTFVALMIDKQIAKGTVDSVQRREVTKSKGLKETRWILNYHFALQNGQQFQGESYCGFSSLTKGAQVEVEYYPKRPQSNRIRGMSAKADDGNMSVFGFIVLVVGLIVLASGLHEASRISKLLQFGLLGSAIVTHCSKTRSGAILEVNGFRWRENPKRKEIPLLDFQQQVNQQHRKQFDEQGKYIGTAMLRTVHVALAMFYGALVSGFVAFAMTIFVFGAPVLWIVLGCLVPCAVAMATIELRWRVLLRINVRMKSDDVPLPFKKALCTLHFLLPDQTVPVRLERELELKGDASDGLPRPLLYLPSIPSKAMFLDAMQLKTSIGTDGEHKLFAENAAHLMIAIFAIVAVGFLGIAIAVLI